MAGITVKSPGIRREEMPRGDGADSLEPVARLLGRLDPSLLLLTDRNGRMVAARHFGERADLCAADTLAKILPARLSASRQCTFTVEHADGFRLAFAVRLPATAASAILGGVVELTNAAEAQLARGCASLIACGLGVWKTVAAQREVAALTAQLRQARKLQTIGQLASGIVHEINTPAQYIRDNKRFVEKAFDKLQSLLTACLELREAAQNETVPAEVLKNLLAVAEQADVPFLMQEVPTAIDQSLDGIDLVTRILHSMMEFAHPSRQQPEAVDLNRVVETAGAICRSQWKHVAELVTDLDPHLPPVTCFPDDLQQVVINLIINAAHAIEEKLGEAPSERGVITVRTRHDGGWVEISIADTGAGIAAGIRGRVFDQFFTTKKAGRGTGQGLAIVHSIVADKYEGTVRFRTEAGRGTTFLVRIPTKPEAVCGGNHHDEKTDPLR